MSFDLGLSGRRALVTAGTNWHSPSLLSESHICRDCHQTFIVEKPQGPSPPFNERHVTPITADYRRVRSGLQ